MMRTPDGQPHYDIWDVVVILGILAGIAALFFL